MVKIGVISDTHGLLRDSARKALLRCDLIVHAGDIGHPRVLDDLRESGEVVAVKGNTDRGSWARALKETEYVQVAGKALYVLHDIARLDLTPQRAGIDVVIYGHSHNPAVSRDGAVLYFNPGSAGPRRFKLPVTIGMLTVESGEIVPEIIPIPE